MTHKNLGMFAPLGDANMGASLESRARQNQPQSQQCEESGLSSIFKMAVLGGVAYFAFKTFFPGHDDSRPVASRSRSSSTAASFAASPQADIRETSGSGVHLRLSPEEMKKRLGPPHKDWSSDPYAKSTYEWIFTSDVSGKPVTVYDMAPEGEDADHWFLGATSHEDAVAFRKWIKKLA